MNKALIYARVSTEEQSKEGQSIEAQIKLCREYAKDNDFTVPDDGVYADRGKSALTTNRPELQSLLHRCDEDDAISAVLVMDTDRLARNTLDHLSIKTLLRKKGIRVISISQPMIDDSPEGRFIDVVLASANALQSGITGRKTSKVMLEKVKHGWWAGPAPHGYINAKNENPVSAYDKRIVKPDPNTADLISKMFDLYASGRYNLKQLTAKMNVLGLRSANGYEMHVSSVHNMLSNPFYYGTMIWKDKKYQGKHEPLTDKETWERCQRIMNEHNQNASRTRKHDFLLRGHLYCDECKSRFWGETRTKRGKRYSYYYCKECGAGTYTKMSDLEEQVVEWFGKVTMTKEYAKELMEEARSVLRSLRSSSEEEREALINQKTAVEKKIRVAEDNLLDGTIKKKRFSAIMERLDSQLLELNESLANIEDQYGSGFQHIEQLIDMATDIKNTYEDANESLKRQYLDLFFQKLMVRDGEIVLAYPSEDLEPLIRNGKIMVQVSEIWLPCVEEMRNCFT